MSRGHVTIGSVVQTSVNNDGHSQSLIPTDILERIDKLNSLVDRQKHTRFRQKQDCNKDYVCKSGDYCSGCACKGGSTLGHMAWDEVEMLQHGFMDRSGHHWGRNEPEDELELLHHGLTDSSGTTHRNRQQSSDQKSVAKTQTISDDPNKHVKIDEKPHEYTYNEEEHPKTENRNRSVRQSNIDNSGVSRDEFIPAEGAKLIIWQTFESRAWLLHTASRFMYLERNLDGSSLLVTGKDGTTKRISVPAKST